MCERVRIKLMSSVFGVGSSFFYELGAKTETCHLLQPISGGILEEDGTITDASDGESEYVAAVACSRHGSFIVRVRIIFRYLNHQSQLHLL